MKRIAFLGLGAMGSRMATRLLESGKFSLTVWNRTAASAEPLTRAGARLAATPREAANGADVVISMLTDDNAARSVWLDPTAGALGGMLAGAVAIESSTVSPAWIAALHQEAAAKGVELIDAPVAGSRPQAESGQLIFMLGGSAASIDNVREVLAPMAASVQRAGEVGSGATLKLAVNALFAAQLQSVAELLGFLKSAGFDSLRAAELLAHFPVTSAPAAAAAKLMATRGEARLFTVDLLEKDLGYAIEAARTHHASLPGAMQARETFRAAQARGLGSENFSSIAALFV